MLIRFASVATLVVVFLSLRADAQLINGRFITSVYTFEKFDTVDASKKFARGFQSAMFDIGHKDFSLHTHVQGAMTLQRNLDELPDLRFFNLFGRWRNIGNAVDLTFGRFPFYVGVGSGSVDGAMTTARVAGGTVRLAAYGGANVPERLELKRWKPLTNNFTVGGQIITTAITNTRLGLSYMNRHRERPSYWTVRPDSLFNPLTVYIEPEPAKEQYVSGDASYRVQRFDVYGRYDYDLNMERTQRGQFGVRLVARDDLVLSGDFIHRAPRVLAGSFFAVFNTATTNEFELGADYLIVPTVRFFVRSAFVSFTDDESIRYTFGIAHSIVSFSVRGSSGNAGELSLVSVQGTYPLFERRFMPSAGVSYASYRFSPNVERLESFAGVAGATVRPFPFVSLDVQAQWLQNRIYKNDVRLNGRLNYWFSERLGLLN